jgi:hypothetical protein
MAVRSAPSAASPIRHMNREIARERLGELAEAVRTARTAVDQHDAGTGSVRTPVGGDERLGSIGHSA